MATSKKIKEGQTTQWPQVKRSKEEGQITQWPQVKR
jgi:hypothetical protein